MAETVIEMRLDRDIIQIGVCSEPVFLDGHIMIARATISGVPGFSLHKRSIQEALKSNLLIVTRINNTENSSSTMSWVCRYKSCVGASELPGVSVITDLLLEL